MIRTGLGIVVWRGFLADSEDSYRDSLARGSRCDDSLLRFSIPNQAVAEIGNELTSGFQMKKVEEVRAELAKMSDAQLIEYGKNARKLCRRVPGQKIDKVWLTQLNEARAEWKRRYPPKKLGANPVQ